MGERVWVGSSVHTPPGWICFETVDQWLDSAVHPEWVIVEDTPALLRESDFLRIYAHSPLARIERIVGPWRAGIGRTDATWPLATRQSLLLEVDQASRDVNWHPLTAGYDELTSIEVPARWDGLTVSLRMTDTALCSMWRDTLRSSGAELRDDRADVLIVDDLSRFECGEADHSTGTDGAFRIIVHLCPDPWNSLGSQHQWSGAELPESAPAVDRCQVITASILDSPLLVLQQVAAIRKRGAS